MRNQLVYVATILVKRVNRKLLYPLIATIIVVGVNTSITVAQTVDAGFAPCDAGFINYPAWCTRTATCTTGGLWSVRVVSITGTIGSFKACPGTDVTIPHPSNYW